VVAFAAIGALAYEMLPPPASAAVTPATGTASINSRPDGAQVTIDGISRGVTPLRLALPLGSHTLGLRNGSEVRSIPLTIEAGTTLSQHVDLVPAPPKVVVGALDITSDPMGAEVRLDGVVRGKTPLTLGEIQVGEHTVAVGKGSGAVSRRIKIAPGATASVVISPKPEGVPAGWIAFRAPVEFRVFEEGRMIGMTSADRLMIPSGRHDFELVNESLEFRTNVSVQVGAGQVATATVKVPNGSLSVNALPWADVMVDGVSAGATPLANLSLPIGSHEVVWRHPELGERRRTVTVPANTPARIGMDFSK
jgi:hypothetical protein